MTFPVAPTKQQTYNLGPVKPWVSAAAYYLGPMFGIKDIGGWRQSDPFPDHPSGHALDFMTDIPNGNRLADYAIANYQALGIKYIIHNHQVWNPQQGWHPYNGTNPHTDHVHITFNDTPGSAFVNGTLNGQAFVAANGVNLVGVADSSQDDPKCAWQIKTPNADSVPIFGSFLQGCIISKTAFRGFLGGLFLGAALIVGIAGTIILVYSGKDTEAGNAVHKSAAAVTTTAIGAATLVAK